MQLNRIIILLAIVFSQSCTEEAVINSYSVSVINNTNSLLEIRCFSERKLLVQKTIGQMESIKLCEYTGEFFYGLSGCEKDSLVIQFENSKGYIDVRIRNKENNYRFENEKSIFVQGNWFENMGNAYEFLVSQEDFENANELPE